MCCSEGHGNEPQRNYDIVNVNWGNHGSCNCQGSVGYCCGTATQEDGNCDRCREVCVPISYELTTMANADMETQIFANALATVFSLILQRDIPPEEMINGIGDQELGCALCSQRIGEFPGALNIGEGDTPKNPLEIAFPFMQLETINQFASDLASHMIQEHTDGLNAPSRLMLAIQRALSN